MGYTNDLLSNLFWVCSADLAFTKDDNLEENCVVRIRSRREDKEAQFLVVKEGLRYRLAQILPSPDDEAEQYQNHTLRHPALFIQEHRLPACMPVAGAYMGPMIHVNMMRILRMVQAKLSDDSEVSKDAFDSLHIYYNEKQSIQPVTGQVVSFPQRKAG